MRRPIGEYDPSEILEPVRVSDEAGNAAPADLDPDARGRVWVDLSDPERPIELRFDPTWFEVGGTADRDSSET